MSEVSDKTVVVKVLRMKKHPKYGKYIKVSKKYKAHDEKNEFGIGNYVIIESSRPISKDKKWKVKGLVAGKKSKKVNA